MAERIGDRSHNGLVSSSSINNNEAFDLPGPCVANYQQFGKLYSTSAHMPESLTAQK